MVHGVIMAGGSGTRFWPMSRKKRPKQLLPITGPRSMIQQTFRRLTGSIPPERIHVITNAEQVDGVISHLPQVPAENIVAEPCSRNTAACIGLAAVRIARHDPDGIMVVVPADSHIDSTDAFLEVLKAACTAAESADTMVIIGIPPTFPATGYGYIRRGRQVFDSSGVKLFEVQEFKEKPDELTAAEFLRTGEYYWNSGSFIWKVSTIMAAFEEFMPELHDALLRIADSLGSPREAEVVAAEYERMPNTSIDYGVMEFARNVKVVEATYGWDDVGSWQSIENVRERDAQGNVVDGNHIVLDTANCTIMGDDHLIAAVGVEDLVIIHTPDATLVCRKDRAQDVRKVVDQLHEKGLHEYL